jgi:hypothetical protein
MLSGKLPWIDLGLLVMKEAQVKMSARAKQIHEAEIL